MAMKTHQWFAGFDWGGVQSGEYFNQASMYRMHLLCREYYVAVHGTNQSAICSGRII